ncbi:hypothetical protein QBC41DRAFT_190223, partial [Cercophora samala]
QRMSKPPLVTADEPGEGSGSRTPPAPAPPSDYEMDELARSSVRYISDLDGRGGGGKKKKKRERNKRKGGLRKRFRELGERLKRMCGRRRRGVDKGKGREGPVVMGGEDQEEEGEEGRYRGSDLGRVNGRVVVGGQGEIHPALRTRPGEVIDFFNNPPHAQQLATVQEATAMGSSGFAPVMTSALHHPNLPRHPSESPVLPQHHGYNHHHQPVIIASPHPIADTYTHEEDWAHVRQAQAQAARQKASQQTMYTTIPHTPPHLAARPSQQQMMMMGGGHPLAIPERHSSRWRARSFMSGSFRSRSRNRSQCGSFDSRTSWNPFDLPGPPKKTLMSDMESLLAGKSSMMGGKRSQGSLGPPPSRGRNTTTQTSFPWPPATSVNNNNNNKMMAQPDSAVSGMGLRVDEDGVGAKRSPAAAAAAAALPCPSMMPVRTPSTGTTNPPPTLGRNSSQKTDNGSNSGTTWTGTGS